MKRTSLIFLIVAGSSIWSYAQHFALKASRPLSDTLICNGVNWMSIDNDGLLDAVVYGTNARGHETLVFFRNREASGFDFVRSIDTEITNAAFLLTDYDGDHMADVIVSGKQNGQSLTLALINRGDFFFEVLPLFEREGEAIRLADLDGDGIREFLLSGDSPDGPFFHIMKKFDTGWALAYDSISIRAQDIELFDFDSDNDIDFFVAGIDAAGEPVNRFFYNEKDFYFTSLDFDFPLLGSTTLSDINHDGNFDLLVAGAGEENLLRMFISSPPGFEVRDSALAVSSADIFAADFNSDGRYDLNVFGFLAADDTLNTIGGINHTDTLHHSGLVTQKFGDLERDGDLDLLQISRGASGYDLVLLENVHDTENIAPGPPRNPVTFYVFDRLFIGWERPVDDRTPKRSLTYDLSVEMPLDIMGSEFDVQNGKRNVIRHGNSGTAHYWLLRIPERSPFDFNIQTVDNAFHADKGSICKGTGGLQGNCGTSLTIAEVHACRKEQILLPSEEVAEWYSFEKGFMTVSKSFSFEIEATDTIFSITRSEAGCEKVQVYVIEVLPILTKSTESVEYVCEGDLLSCGAESDWQSTQWTSAVHGLLGTTDSISYQISVPDTIMVAISDGMGCEITRRTILHISRPVIDVAHDGYQIMKGESVQLDVSGGVHYEWNPSSGLSDLNSPNPSASPLKTTEYTVTVMDSIGCQAQAKVIVIVEQTAFIPDLFTPNHDGSNDVLKIYALGQVTNFSFAIYNREGSRVYFTSDPADAVNGGWDGTASGAEQPAGIYHWIVNGLTGNGAKLQLNGKNSGAIVLVR
jgi:gliding motility-associated-like protein